MWRVFKTNTKIKQLHDAIQEGNIEKVALLLQGSNVNSCDENDVLPLHRASQTGQVAMVKLLIHAGASVNGLNEVDKTTALHHASFHGHLVIVRALLEARAQVDSGDDEGKTALHKASRQGHLAVVQALIAAKANINTVDTYQERALHEACRRGHKAIVAALIAAGADVNMGSLFAGEKPLYLASSKGHLKIVQVLLNHGASIFRGAERQQVRQDQLVPLIKDWLRPTLSTDEVEAVDWPASALWILNMLPRLDYLVKQEAEKHKVPVFSTTQGQDDLLTLFQYLAFLPQDSVKLADLQNGLLQTLILIKRKLPMELIDMIQDCLIEDKKEAILALPHLEAPVCAAVLFPYLMQRLKTPTVQDFSFFQELGLVTWIKEPPYLSRAMSNLTISR